MRTAAIAAVMLALGGCASNVSLSDRLAGGNRVRGDAESVTVTGMGSRVEALPLAVGHCGKFGRAAQFAARAEGGAYVFSCVPA